MAKSLNAAISNQDAIDEIPKDPIPQYGAVLPNRFPLSVYFSSRLLKKRVSSDNAPVNPGLHQLLFIGSLSDSLFERLQEPMAGPQLLRAARV